MVSVRGSLRQLEDIADIQTNYSLNLCSFRIRMDEAVLQARLEELEATNEHLKGWSKVELVGPVLPAN